MRRVVYPLMVAAVGYLVMMAVASVVLPGVEVGYLWDLVACALLTTSAVVLRRVARRAGASARWWTWGLGLVTVTLSLVLTTLVAPPDGFSVTGTGSWIGTVLLVWLATPVYDEVARRTSRRRPATPGEASRRRTAPPSDPGPDQRPPYAGGTAGGTLPPGPPRDMPRSE